MKIIKYPATELASATSPFDFSNPIMDPVELEKILVQTMLDNGGIGLAANQVGLNAAVFVMGSKENIGACKAYFNPEIMQISEETNTDYEGCLSFPGVFIPILRPIAVGARWQNRTGTWEHGVFTGYDARCFYHEYDHLCSITMRDRISNLKWNRAVKKSNKGK